MMGDGYEHIPAFPQPATDDGHATNTAPGMSLRDYFAGQALAGMAGTVNWWESSAHESAAHACYQIADAMLKEREPDHG